MRSPNKTFLGGAKGCQAALEWSKLMRFNLNDKEFLSAADTLVIIDQITYFKTKSSNLISVLEL